MIYPDKGYIGCFEMEDKDAGKRQVAGYVEALQKLGHKRIIAPIDGDTWHKYRLVSWSSGAPPFPLEPQNPLWYNEVFTELGFVPLKEYRSDCFPITNIAPLAGAEIESGLQLRAYQGGDLRLIYDISLQGFDENFLYNDITYEAFSALYEPVLPMVDPQLAVIALVDGCPAGFLFALGVGDMLILKSMAVLPAHRSRGIGAQLINHVLRAGEAKGLHTAIAALIAAGNNSHKIPSKYGSEQLRGYTLYSLEV